MIYGNRLTSNRLVNKNTELGLLSPEWIDGGGGFDFIEGGGGGGFDWNRVLDIGASLGSQVIAGTTKNPTSQVYVSSSGVNPIPTSTQSQYGTQSRPQSLTTAQIAALQAGGTTAGSTVGAGVDGIGAFISQNPVLVLGGLLGAYLLFKDPPRRK